MNGSLWPRLFRKARLVLKGLNPANPTWLAYVLYGEPRRAAQQGLWLRTQVRSRPSQTPPRDSRHALKKWLDHWGFTRDPFSSFDADQREILPMLLVDRPYADRMLGPKPGFLLATPGAGKSAAR